MAGIRIEGNTSGNVVEVNASNEIKVALSQVPANIGGVRMFSENDPGDVTGTPYLYSPETDEDFRLRVAQESVLDNETFNYTAQNTGKHYFQNTTMAATWSAAGFTTNSGNITTLTTGVGLSTYAMFPLIGTTEVYCEMEAAFTAQPTSNTAIDFGLFLRAITNPFAPTDGVYFRLNSAGLQGVINRGGVETATNITFAYTNSQVYQFVISCHEREVKFWIDDVLYLSVPTPVADGQPFQSASLPVSVRHAIVGGAAGAAISFQLKDYTVSVGGGALGIDPWNQGNRLFGSYQGLSGGTMGSLALYVNSANPTAAVPTNTTAALGSGLGGQFWETDTLAVTTDGVICSYQVPAGSITVQGRRLVIQGVSIDSYIQVALTGGGYVAQWSLAFGHTAVSLATAEGAATKASRRVPLGVQSVVSAAAISTVLTRVTQTFSGGPIYVNPGEFVAVVKKKVGTAPSAGVIAHAITFIYGWE